MDAQLLICTDFIASISFFFDQSDLFLILILAAHVDKTIEALLGEVFRGWGLESRDLTFIRYIASLILDGGRIELQADAAWMSSVL